MLGIRKTGASSDASFWDGGSIPPRPNNQVATTAKGPHPAGFLRWMGKLCGRFLLVWLAEKGLF